MWASLTYILLLAPAFIPSAVAQCSINLSAIADAVLFFDPANTTEFTYTFDFNGFELETIVPEVQYPDGQSIGCTVPVNYAADFAGPQGIQTVTCPVSVGTMPSGVYNFNIFLGNGGEASVPFTITHSEVTVVAGYTTVAVPVTVTQRSTATVSQTVTTTSLVPGQTTTQNIGGFQTTVTKPVDTITSTSTITKTTLETKTKVVNVTTCVPTLVARRGRLNRRDVAVMVSTTITNTVTSSVIATSDITTTVFTTVVDTGTATPVTTMISAASNTATVAGSTVTSWLFTTKTTKQHTTVTVTKTAAIRGQCP